MASEFPTVGTMSSSDSDDRDSDDKQQSDCVSEDGSQFKFSISAQKPEIRTSIDSDSDGGFYGGNPIRSDSTSDDATSPMTSYYGYVDDARKEPQRLKRSRPSPSSMTSVKKKSKPESTCLELNQADTGESDEHTEDSSWISPDLRDDESKAEGRKTYTETSTNLWRQTDDDNVPSYSTMYRPKKETVFKDLKAARMMEKMGYQPGKGLGKKEQGITEPVQVSKQRGRRGLGLSLQGLEPESLEFNSEDAEPVSVEEQIDWLHNTFADTVDPSMSWAKEGKKKLTIDEDTFCPTKILKEVMNSKSTFDALEGKELRKAVSRSNPFETIRGGIFLNRAAMKMANMDKVFDFMFTRPKYQNGKHMVNNDELLYFADVCAGPGGFSEYVLWRLKWKAKGFGFTLKSENDFKLSDFFAGPCESFEPHYGYTEDENPGDGDVYNKRNQEVFFKFVHDNTDGHGVHFMMADGGFSVEGQENIQEILSKQLYLCQFLVALHIVRTNGHFVCKVFDLFTEFSVGLIYLLYRSFEQISIHKPNSSRPANSERYVICKWKRSDCTSIANYLSNVNKLICDLDKGSDRDIVSVVPFSVMEKDEVFMRYIFNSNKRIGDLQIKALKTVIAFCKDPSLEEIRQTELRKKSLEYWEVPDDARKAPNKSNAEELFPQILKESSSKGSGISPSQIHLSQEKVLSLINLETIFTSVFNWYCVVLGNSNTSKDNLTMREGQPFSHALTFFLGTGRSSVFYLSRSDRKWVKAAKLELSAGTLLLGEIAQEIIGQKAGQRKTYALHIVDAICLGGTYIEHYHITERMKFCKLFAKAMNKPSRNDLNRIHAKELFELINISKVNERVKMLTMKNSKLQKVFELNRDGASIVPQGLIFFNAVQDPWVRTWSNTYKKCYYFHTKNRDSKFEEDRPEDACKNAVQCYLERAASWWDDRLWNAITIEDISDFVQRKLPPSFLSVGH